MLGKTLYLILLCLLIAPTPYAEGIASITFENDLFASNADKYYTHGSRFAYMALNDEIPPLAEHIAHAVPGFNLKTHTGLTWSIGQNLYTPKIISTSSPDPKDRPYAALLYGSASLATANKDFSEVDELELLLGWVGPGAQGEYIQKRVHEAVGAQKPMGWDHQLNDEPVLNLTWQRRWPQSHTMALGPLRLSTTPHVGFALGNAFTYGAAGFTVSLTPLETILQDEPLRVRPALPGTGYFETSANKLGWEIFAGAEGRAVARNILLDGNSFGNSPSVDKKIVVGDLQAGLALTYNNIRIGYTAVYRTKEFQGQTDPAIFGALSLSIRF